MEKKNKIPNWYYKSYLCFSCKHYTGNEGKTKIKCKLRRHEDKPLVLCSKYEGEEKE